MDSKREPLKNPMPINGKQILTRLYLLTKLLDNIQETEVKHQDFKSAHYDPHEAYFGNMCRLLNKILKKNIKHYFANIPLSPEAEQQLLDWLNALIAEFAMRREVVTNPKQYFLGVVSLWKAPLGPTTSAHSPILSNIYQPDRLKTDGGYIDAISKILECDPPADEKLLELEDTKARIATFQTELASYGDSFVSYHQDICKYHLVSHPPQNAKERATALDIVFGCIDGEFGDYPSFPECAYEYERLIFGKLFKAFLSKGCNEYQLQPVKQLGTTANLLSTVLREPEGLQSDPHSATTTNAPNTQTPPARQVSAKQDETALRVVAEEPDQSKKLVMH